MNHSPYKVVKAQVSFRMYLPEGVLLLLSFATPVVACVFGHSGSIFSRSGSIMVFLAALAEFITLNRINTKHILNACRAKEKDDILDFSCPATVIGITSLIAALLGTLIWGFGDLLFRT